jgi:hypothetical protein
MAIENGGVHGPHRPPNQAPIMRLAALRGSASPASEGPIFARLASRPVSYGGAARSRWRAREAHRALAPAYTFNILRDPRVGWTGHLAVKDHLYPVRCDFPNTSRMHNHHRPRRRFAGSYAP